jgi:DNA-damage-inducible protein J
MTMVHVRLDDALKDRATDALDRMGLTLSEAVRMFLTRVAADQAIPFDVKVPNATTRAAMEEARRMAPARFSDFVELEREFSPKVAG